MNEISLEIEAGCAVISLDAPTRRNSITVGLARDLIAACEAVDQDTSIGAAIVTGRGPAFCAGAYRPLLDFVGSNPTHDSAFSDLKLVYESFARVGSLRVPTITAVAGPAVGAGANLALAGDICIVGENAAIRPGFIPIGAHPGGGHFHLLERRAGRQVAAAVGLFGSTLIGPQIVEAGLALECVPDGEVLARAEAIAAVPAADPGLARLAVETFDRELDRPGMSWPSAIQLEHAPQMWSLHRRARAMDSPTEGPH